jgi:BASS family bile acid:Na+ symporter
MAMLALGVAIGLAWPAAGAVLHHALAALVFLLMTGAFLGIERDAVIERLGRPVLLVLALLWVLIAAPLMVDAAVRLGHLPHGLADAMVLWAGAAPIVSAAPLALLLGLDGALSLIVILLATMAMP